MMQIFIFLTVAKRVLLQTLLQLNDSNNNRVNGLIELSCLGGEVIKLCKQSFFGMRV